MKTNLQKPQSSLDDWNQGDYTYDCNNFYFLGSNGVKNLDTQKMLLEQPFNIKGCVLISQTCDIIREPNIIPNVSVCPLVEVSNNRIKEISGGRAPRFGLIPSLQNNLAIDFSYIMNVSKELLIFWKPNIGFKSSLQLENFTKSLTNIYNRFAFPENFIELLSPIRKVIHNKHDKNSELGKALRSIRELRVLPYADWSETQCIPISFLVIIENVEMREIDDLNEIEDILLENVFSKINWENYPYTVSENFLILDTDENITMDVYFKSHSLSFNMISSFI